MNLYKKSGWFSLIVSILLIIKIFINSISTPYPDTASIVVASILPIILIYISICLIKAKDKKASATTTSVITPIISLFFIIFLILKVSSITVIIITMIITPLSFAALLTINWYLGKTKGLIITLFILFIISTFVGGYYRAGFSSSTNSQTSSVSDKTSQLFSTYSMSNGLKVSYPTDWIANKGDNEYVVDLSTKDNQTIVEVSYNVFEDNTSKNANQWKAELIKTIKANPNSGIDQSSIVIKKYNGNDALMFNQVTDMNYVSQAIFPIESSGNKKYIQFTLNVNKTNHVATDSRDIFNQIIEETLKANYK
jgi:hypothetical protein